VRLGAFAVAHEALSQVVLLIAEMSGGIGWLALLIGTIVVVAFEGLIVGIQTLRLEYYEFFGRFFRGEGRPFKPLHLAQGRQP
jgi:V/A-type H+-transporting ATPase subunit I